MVAILVFAVVLLIVVGIICAIAYQIPWPAPMAWLSWAIPAIVLLIALVILIERFGLLSGPPLR